MIKNQLAALRNLLGYTDEFFKNEFQKNETGRGIGIFIVEFKNFDAF